MLMPDYPTDALNEALKRLRRSPFLPAAVRHLGQSVSAMAGERAETGRAEIPAFTESRNPQVLPERAETLEALRPQQSLAAFFGVGTIFTGAVMIDGKMQDDATVKQCRGMVELARVLSQDDAELRAAYKF